MGSAGEGPSSVADSTHFTAVPTLQDSAGRDIPASSLFDRRRNHALSCPNRTRHVVCLPPAAAHAAGVSTDPKSAPAGAYQIETATHADDLSPSRISASPTITAASRNVGHVEFQPGCAGEELRLRLHRHGKRQCDEQRSAGQLVGPAVFDPAKFPDGDVQIDIGNAHGPDNGQDDGRSDAPWRHQTGDLRRDVQRRLAGSGRQRLRHRLSCDGHHQAQRFRPRQDDVEQLRRRRCEADHRGDVPCSRKPDHGRAKQPIALWQRRDELALAHRRAGARQSVPGTLHGRSAARPTRTDSCCFNCTSPSG